MIGRFANLGDYEDLLKNSDFLKVGFAGLLALAGFIIGKYGTSYHAISQ